MQKTIALLKKELFYYLNNPVGYIAAVSFSIFANFLFVKDLFLRGNSSMRPFFDILPWLGLIFIPALSMRVFAEEKRSHTIEVLLSLPIEEKIIVMGKFLSLLAFTGFSLSLTLSIPIALFYIGKLLVLEVIVSYFGALLLLSSFISIALFFSSLTKNQIVAFISAALTLFFVIVLGGDFLSSIFPRVILEYVSIVTPFYHYGVFLKGIVDIRSIFYFVSATTLFIFLTIINLEKRD